MSSHLYPARLSPLIASIALALCACGSTSANTPGQSTDQQSLAEYDVARDLWQRQRKPREALERALKAVELDDENADAAYLVALIYLDFCSRSPSDCRLAEAERYAKLALEAHPQFREATNTLAVIYVHQERYDDAIAVLKPLTQDILYQTPEIAWGNIGWAYLKKGDYDLAIDALRRSTAAQPAFCVGHYRLGLVYERTKNWDSAVRAFTRALEVDQGRCRGLQDAYAGRGRALIQLGRTDEAQADLKECVRLDKSTEAGRQCSSLSGKLE